MVRGAFFTLCGMGVLLVAELAGKALQAPRHLTGLRSVDFLVLADCETEICGSAMVS
jgi:hypothetical protein